MASIKTKPTIPLLSVAAFLLAWEAAARWGVADPSMVGSPSRILQEGFELFVSGYILPHLAVSLAALFLGYILSATLSILISFVLASGRKAYGLLSPYVYALTFLPMAAVVPLIIIWFGVGFASKVVVIGLLVAAPVLINTLDGIRAASGELTVMARSFGADKYFMLRHIALPGALPFIFSGLRLGVGRGLVGLVVSEIFGYGKGLGYLVSFYSATFNAPRLMFIVLVLALINYACIAAISFVESRLVKWKT